MLILSLQDNVNARVTDKEQELDRLLKEVEVERKQFADVKRENAEKVRDAYHVFFMGL